MDKLKKVMIIAWSVHFVLLGTYITGHMVGNWLADQIIQEPVNLTK